MDLSFKTKEQYLGFLEKLLSYCDTVAILSEDDLPVKVVDEIVGCRSEVKLVREFPGYGKFKGKIRVEVPFYPLNKKVREALKEYESFLKVGFNIETGLGFDMAFYKGQDVVFLVLRHEDMNYLEKDYQQYFDETIQKYSIKPKLD